MKTLFLVYILLIFTYNLPQRIIIKVDQNDQVNLSDLVDEVIVVPLKSKEYNLNSIDKIFIIDNSIFILNIYEDNGKVYSFVLKFDMSGDLVENIGVRKPDSKEFARIYDMKYDITDKSLYLLYQDGYRKYGNNNDILYFSEGSEISPGTRAVQEFIFQNSTWRPEYSFNNNEIDISIIRSDLNNDSRRVIRGIKFESITGRPSTIGIAHFSAQKDKLFVSFGTDRTIYEVNKEKLTPVYRAEFTDLPKSDINLEVTQSIIGKYIQNSYWLNWISYDHIFNSETGKSFNIKYQTEKGKIVSGVRDDLYNTGFFKISHTNIDDYIYFIRKQEELKGINSGSSKQNDPVLFLIKLK